VALGGMLGIAALLVWPLAQNSSLLVQYAQALTQRTQTHGHVSPLLGTALVLLVGEGRFGLLQFLPMIPGLIWLPAYWRRHRTDWRWEQRLPALLFASFLTASYGAWPFDLVVLLIPILQQAARLPAAGRRQQLTALAVYLAVNVLALVQLLRETSYFWFVWMTPALLAAYLVSASCRPQRSLAVARS
jgi:hypothetical protein